MKVFFWLPCSLPNYQQKSHFSSLDKVWSLSRQLISAMPISEDDFGFAAWAAIVTSEKRLSFPQLCQFLRPRRHGAVASKRWENVDHNRRLVQPFGTPFPKRNPAYGKVLRGLLMGEVWWKYMEIWWRMRNECCGCMFHPTSKGLSWVLNQCNGPWRCLLRMGEAQDHFFEDNILMFLLNEWQQEQVFHGITWPWSYLCQKIAETLITPIPQDHMKPVFAATRLLAWPGYSPISVVCKVFSIFDTLCIVRCRRENSQLHLPSHYNLWKHLVVRSQLDSKFYPKETIMWYLSQKSHDLPDVLLSIFVTSLVIFSVCLSSKHTNIHPCIFTHKHVCSHSHQRNRASCAEIKEMWKSIGNSWHQLADFCKVLSENDAMLKNSWGNWCSYIDMHWLSMVFNIEKPNMIFIFSMWNWRVRIQFLLARWSVLSHHRFVWNTKRQERGSCLWLDLLWKSHEQNGLAALERADQSQDLQITLIKFCWGDWESQVVATCKFFGLVTYC